MDGTDGDSEPATAGSTPETTPTEQRKVSLADVKKRLEAEKKRIANLRKNRIGTKATSSPKSPKGAPGLKRRAERKSVGDVESKKRKIVTPPKIRNSASPEVPPRRKGGRPVAAVKVDPEPEKEVEENTELPAVVEDSNAEANESTVEEPQEEQPSTSGDSVEKKDDSEACLPSDTEYVIGYKLEAKDFNQDWYPARVVEVDYDDREVLVHFERWSSRYDEWISMDSPRLRPPGPLSVTGAAPKITKSVPKPKTPVPPVEAPMASPPQSAEKEKPTRKFKKDDSVMASWSDSRKYAAKVLEVLDNDTYSVLFYDGFTKTIKGNRMTPARPGLQIEPPAAPPAPLVPITTLYPPDEDIGSKADRRERKRKHIVTDLFSMRPRMSPSASSTTTKTSPSSALKSAPSSAAKSTPSTTKSTPTTTKSTPATAKSTPTTAKPPPASTSKTSDGPPPTKRGRGRNQAPKQQNPGQEDLMLIKSLSGGAIDNTHPVNKSKGRSPAVSATVTSDARRVKTLMPRAKGDDSPVTEPPPPHNPCTRPLETLPTGPPPASILSGIEIEMDGDNYKCPNKDCGKLYRKESLLQMHIKHYHPELKSLLVVVPKVLDFAYARTVGDLPSTAVTQRSSAAHAPSNASASSPAPSTPAPTSRKSFTPQVVLKKPAKVSEKPEKTEKAEKTEEKEKIPPPIQINEDALPALSLPPPSPLATSPVKTGHIKTLLPVNRSPVKSQVEEKVREKPTSVPLSALQQALMSPPGHLAAQMLHHNTVDSKPRTPIKTEVKPHFVSPQRMVSHRGRAKEDKSHNKELVNCMCGIPEEDGLMIQCDLCMCWQHGACNMIETDDQVPDKYVCHICLHPARQRLSRKYAHDQDWLKEGILPRMPIRRNQAKVTRTNTEKILKESHDITATIIRLQEVIHSLRVKINIAEKADHPKLYLWSKRWEDDIDPVKTEEVKTEVKSSEQEVDTMSLKPSEDKINDNMLDKETAGMSLDKDSGDMSLSQDDKPCNDEADIHPALKLPLSQSELEHLASSVENKLRATEESSVAVLPPPPAPTVPVKAPEPEAAIQPAECRLVLLEHIERLQAKLEARLAVLEARAEEIEADDDELLEPEGGSSRTKETLRLLQRDLSSVTRISNYASSE